MDVALVRWPVEESLRLSLRERGTPRLLLVEDGPPPRLDGDCLEDWIRIPADDADVRARVEALEHRSAAHVLEKPVLDDDGLLRFNSAWVSIPPVETRLLQALLDRYGAVVSRDALARAGWPAGAPGRNALDVHVLRLRRRIAPLGLAITTVRARGYLLEESEFVQQAVRHA